MKCVMLFSLSFLCLVLSVFCACRKVEKQKPNGKEPLNPEKEKSSDCELLSLSLDGEKNGLANTINFTLDKEKGFLDF